MKKKLTERALIARINRKLANDSQALKKCRENSQWFNELGYYYIVDETLNTITAQNIKLDKLGKELGVLAEFEELAA